MTRETKENILAPIRRSPHSPMSKSIWENQVDEIKRQCLWFKENQQITRRLPDSTLADVIRVITEIAINEHYQPQHSGLWRQQRLWSMRWLLEIYNLKSDRIDRERWKQLVDSAANIIRQFNIDLICDENEQELLNEASKVIRANIIDKYKIVCIDEQFESDLFDLLCDLVESSRLCYENPYEYYSSQSSSYREVIHRRDWPKFLIFENSSSQKFLTELYALPIIVRAKEICHLFPQLIRKKSHLGLFEIYALRTNQKQAELGLPPLNMIDIAQNWLSMPKDEKEQFDKIAEEDAIMLDHLPAMNRLITIIKTSKDPIELETALDIICLAMERLSPSERAYLSISDLFVTVYIIPLAKDKSYCVRAKAIRLIRLWLVLAPDEDFESDVGQEILRVLWVAISAKDKSPAKLEGIACLYRLISQGNAKCNPKRIMDLIGRRSPKSLARLIDGLIDTVQKYPNETICLEIIDTFASSNMSIEITAKLLTQITSMIRDQLKSKAYNKKVVIRILGCLKSLINPKIHILNKTICGRLESDLIKTLLNVYGKLDLDMSIMAAEIQSIFNSMTLTETSRPTLIYLRNLTDELEMLSGKKLKTRMLNNLVETIRQKLTRLTASPEVIEIIDLSD